MKIRSVLAVIACGAAVVLLTGCAYPVKVTGGGKAVGLAQDATGTLYENVPATAAGQAKLTEPVPDGYTGKGNFQFVDHLTGMCFHAELEFGGAYPGLLVFLDPWWVESFSDWENLAYAEGWVRDCSSGDGAYDDGYAYVWLYDAGVPGPDKGDRVVVMRDPYPYAGVLPYGYDGVLESGNYTLHAVKTK